MNQHIVLGIVIDDPAAHHHIPDADMGAHVARNAGKNDAVHTEFGDEHLRGGRGVGLAHARAAHHHPALAQIALMILHPRVRLYGHAVQQGAELIHLFGHGAQNTDDIFHVFLLIALVTR